MTNRPARVVLALALVVATLAACGGDDEDAATEDVTVVLDWTPNTNHAGVYLALANGWYTQAGLSVRVVEPGDAGAVQLLAAGEADVAFSAQEELIAARAQGVPAVAVAAVVQHNTSSLLSLAEDGIDTPADLAGHTYGGFGGPLERALVEALIGCDGGDPGAVDFADVGDVDYRAGLEADQYDFVWIFDGWDRIRLAELEGLDVATIPFIEHTDCIPDWYTPMMAVTEEGLADRHDALDTFMDVTRRGYQEAMADPAAAADALLAAVPELDPILVRASAEYLASRYSDDPASWGEQETAVWERFAEFVATSGMVDDPDRVEVDGAFTNELLTGGP